MLEETNNCIDEAINNWKEVEIVRIAAYKAEAFCAERDHRRTNRSSIKPRFLVRSTKSIV